MPRESVDSGFSPRSNCQWSAAGAARTVRVMPTAIVTGASRGLGLALARALAARGWRLAIDGREAAPLEAAAAEPGAGAVVGDVADAAHRAALVAAAGGP